MMPFIIRRYIRTDDDNKGSLPATIYTHTRTALAAPSIIVISLA